MSAIGTVKNMSAILLAVDTRVAVKEKVHSWLVAEYLEINIKEHGENQVSYAKIMWKEFNEALIETALIAK